MKAKNSCTSANTAITGDSHVIVVAPGVVIPGSARDRAEARDRQITTLPSTTCQKVHSRNEPSWPSQKQLAMYFIGICRLLCFHT